MEPIDLRSDTVTRPSQAMRQAIAKAPVGDDVYGEDPSVNLLEERVAALLGKEAAVLVPSGTAANQIALLVHCQRGDNVFVGAGAHQMCFEAGAGAALAGVQFTVVGQGGLFTAADVSAGLPPDDVHFPPPRLVSIEDTHNRAGGRVWPIEQLRAVAKLTKERGLVLHLDGARLLNAAIASHVPAAARAAPFDTVSLCLSKGLGAPAGSLLAGNRPLVQRARRFRKMLGGAMRQAGILAAAGLYALDHHVARLAEDHENAKRLAETLATTPHVSIVGPVETNIVLIDLDEQGPDAPRVSQQARAQGLLLNPVAPRRLRVVTHLDVNRTACDKAAAILNRILRA